MESWNPLWMGIVNSSVWCEPYPVRVLFTTMLAVKDRHQMVYGSAYALAQVAKMSEKEVLGALKVLASPDTKRVEKQEYEGRRIKAIDDGDGGHIGWLVLNGAKYQRKMMGLLRAEYKREWMRANRRGKRGPKMEEHSTDEGAHCRNLEAGYINEHGEFKHEKEEGGGHGNGMVRAGGVGAAVSVPGGGECGDAGVPDGGEGGCVGGVGGEAEGERVEEAEAAEVVSAYSLGEALKGGQ